MSIQPDYFQAPYQAQWKQMHPDKEYPTPQKNPHMFPAGAHTQQYTEEVNNWFPQCTARKCPRGLIDYQCQYANGCYLKLLQLGVNVFLTVIALAVLFALFGKAMTALYHIITGIDGIRKIAGFISACLSCLSLGMFEQPIVIVEVQKQQNTNKKGKKLNEKLKDLNIEVDVEALNNFQMDRIEQILSDYEIESQKRTSTVVKQ